MKRVISYLLALTVVLSFCIISSSVGAEPTEDKDLVEYVYDMTGCIHGSGYLSTGYYPTYTDANENYVSLQNAFRFAVYGTLSAYTPVGASYATEVHYARNRDKDAYFTIENSLNGTDDAPTSGIIEISGKYLGNKATPEGLIDYASGQNKVILNRVSGGANDATFSLTKLKANVWYEFKYTINLDATPQIFTVSYRAEGDDEDTEHFEKTFTSKIFKQIRVDQDYTDTAVSTGNYHAYKDLKMTKSMKKTTILSVNNGQDLNPGVNEITFKATRKIPSSDTKPEYIKAVDKDGNEIKALSASAVGSDGEYTYTATMESNLSPWTDYTLVIDNAAYGKCKEIDSDGELIDVTSDGLTMDFSVKPSSFEAREKEKDVNKSNISVTMEVTNVESECEPVTFMMIIFDADGRMEKIKSCSLEELPVDSKTVSAPEMSLSWKDGDRCKIFAINGWENRTPLFAREWNYSYPTDDE